MSPLPQTKAEVFHNETVELLTDPSGRVPELTLRRAVREARTLLGSADQSWQLRLYGLISLLEERIGHMEEAFDAAAKALELEPGDPVALTQMGRFLGKSDKHADALQCFQSVVARTRKGSGAWFMAMANMAECYHRLGRSDEARKAYLTAAGFVDSVRVQDIFGLANVAAVMGLPEDAVELLARFIAASTHEERGDRPALDWIAPAVAGEMRWLREGYPALWQAVEQVMAIDATPVPEDMAIAAERVLPPDAWDRFMTLARG